MIELEMHLCWKIAEEQFKVCVDYLEIGNWYNLLIKQVGTKGMPCFVKVLQEDRMDAEITKLTLETLNILCSDKKDGNQSLGVSLTEIFIKVDKLIGP